MLSARCTDKESVTTCRKRGPRALERAVAGRGNAPRTYVRAPSLDEPDEHRPGVHLHGVGAEIGPGRHAQRRARLVVEAAVVLRALDDVAHHEAVGELGALMRAERVGGVEGVL